jgi:hypothetical protein
MRVNTTRNTWKPLLSLLAVLALSGCGGGSAAAPTGPQKTATVSFSILGNYTTQITAVELVARLPAGVTVALGPGPNELRQPDLKSTKGLVFGSYSASLRQVHLGAVNLLQDIGYGGFATLQCTVQPGFTLTADSFRALNTNLAGFKAVGSDPVLGIITTDGAMQGRITPSIDVTFGY